jgi:hypothetical protein
MDNVQKTNNGSNFSACFTKYKCDIPLEKLHVYVSNHILLQKLQTTHYITDSELRISFFIFIFYPWNVLNAETQRQ